MLEERQGEAEDLGAIFGRDFTEGVLTTARREAEADLRPLLKHLRDRSARVPSSSGDTATDCLVLLRDFPPGGLPLKHRPVARSLLRLTLARTVSREAGMPAEEEEGAFPAAFSEFVEWEDIAGMAVAAIGRALGKDVEDAVSSVARDWLDRPYLIDRWDRERQAREFFLGGSVPARTAAPPSFAGQVIQRKAVVARLAEPLGIRSGEELKNRLRSVKEDGNDPLRVLKPGGPGRAGRGYSLSAVEWVVAESLRIRDLARILSDNATAVIRHQVEEQSQSLAPAALAQVVGPPPRRRRRLEDA